MGLLISVRYKNVGSLTSCEVDFLFIVANHSQVMQYCFRFE
jgi:hypothetical protein